MKDLFAKADAYVQSSGWKEIALVKLCLFSLGLLAGMCVEEQKKENMRISAAFLFTVTYIPLMAGFLAVLFGKPRR